MTGVAIEGPSLIFVEKRKLDELFDKYIKKGEQPLKSVERFLRHFEGNHTLRGANYTMTEDGLEKMARIALDQMSAEETGWDKIASYFLKYWLYLKVSVNTLGMKSTEFHPSYRQLARNLVSKGLFKAAIFDSYSDMELERAGTFVEPARDDLFTYIGLRTLSDRYLTRGHDKELYELPQHRFLTIALTLMVNEPKEKRMDLVKEAYWAMSNLYMTVATPTLSNAGKTHGQLSSCFIDTVDDSLRGIYDSNTDVATLSKGGGGIGVYLGKIRSRGSDIKGFKGVASGTLPWMKQLNNTAVSVDQLGMRQGSIAVYLDIWHSDVLEFLDAKLNNGDERLRTHDLFTGLCIPDLFMQTVEARGEWHLFDPHEVKKLTGQALEDLYDEEDDRAFTAHYEACVAHPLLARKTFPAVDIVKRMLKSQLETGTPYVFFRDTVNRANPNKHEGMIYASNLCSEIAQNMSATTVEEEITKDGKIIITKTPGDFVVCNLSSISLAAAYNAGVIPRVIDIQVRMLDNVIDLNTIEVPQAGITNQKYRAVGLGTFGWHHLLATQGIRWESDEAVEFADTLYEDIAYHTIQASMNLAREKEAYPVFRGSEWHTGEYFKRRGYEGQRWGLLKKAVATFGVRNAYMMAVAPNSSTAIIAGSTASIDPVYKTFYSEEKKNYKIPVAVPDLNFTTKWLYKSGFDIDQLWSIRQNGKRQRHIDQAISFNLYVKNDVQASRLLELHMEAWKAGMKTIYYTRSTAVEIEECESCAS
ncbi:ribonucleoside-diphosphate reductase subunit alpha [bacterium]|nr:ribonucleoside-diphosphate reductase subunit alpha [bacterium]